MVFDEGASKADIVFELSTRIPTNEYGLPEFFIRSDMLHSNQLVDEDIDAASIGLFYFEGYPTLENGSTFWNQLPHEPYEAYKTFQAYLDQADDIGIRQLDMLSASENVDLEKLSAYSKEFYWTYRARAYDLFIVAAEAKKRQRRIMKMENSHFDVAGTLMKKLTTRFEGEFDDWIEELTAKEAIEVLDMLYKIQRASVGLVGQHASSTSRVINPGESSESALRKLAQEGGMSANQGGDFSAKLSMLLDDPEGGATLQAAVLKFTSGGNRTEFSDGV